MSGPRSALPPDIRGLLDCELDVPPTPSVVRARIVARARLATPATVAFVRPSFRQSPRVRWSVVAALTCVAGVAVGAAVYEWRSRSTLPPTVVPIGRALSARPIADAPPTGVAVVNAPSVRRSALGPPRASRSQIALAELRLLRLARAAVAREDFSAALPAIEEHARNFRDGRLAEEREALRVKTLVGLGRTVEARRAAAAFESRFPHSVLQPAVTRVTNVP